MTQPAQVVIGRSALPGLLTMPKAPAGLVIFVQGGSSRFGPRYRGAADDLGRLGFATLLFAPVTEVEAADRRGTFELSVSGARVVEAIDWARADARTAGLGIGLFAAGAGAGAALVAAAARPEEVCAIASCGGRPELAADALGDVRAPTLLIVGGEDHEVLAFNQSAMGRMKSRTSLAAIPGALGLFEESGAWSKAVAAAGRWYANHLRARRLVFDDRAAAGRALAVAVASLAPSRPAVYALPRGGVPVALEIASALDAPLDLLFVRKIGAPGNEELAAAAVVDGERPDLVLNEDVMRAARLTRRDIERQVGPHLKEIERRRALYMPGRPPVSAEGRTAILVDDGVATGASMRAAIAAARRRSPRRVMVAVPVAPAATAAALRELADEVVCLAAPVDFRGVGDFYRDFHQLTDGEIIDRLARRAPAGSYPADSGRAKR
ncbi:MAG: phosphoribosyltransferase family protein [Roseiarcus sp.]